MNKRIQRPDRRMPLPQFLPENDRESIDQLVDIMRARVDAYVAEGSNHQRESLDQETTQVSIESEDDYTATAVSSRKKHIPAVAHQAMDMLTYKPRLNEDVVRAGQRWYVVADGLTNYEGNVCALMGESFALAFEWMIHRMEQMEPKPNLQTVTTAFHAALDRARLILRRAMAHQAAKLNKYTDGDFSTTVEAVYYAPWLKKAVVLHIGDSRSYVTRVNGKSEQLTTDHTALTRNGERTYMSSVLNTDPRNSSRIDVVDLDMQPGDSITSLCDGAFAYEEVTRARAGEPKSTVDTLSENHPTGPDNVLAYTNTLVSNGRSFQDTLSAWDDTSAGALLVK
ncbi:MAG: protein phosphatase 2C domain-containing protein [Candidatus Kerfeldbacteria bacterium]|nr:protein phosphatase 2C domain-containing protein [Candidatus Kerfeldbacteria bacterium]